MTDGVANVGPSRHSDLLNLHRRHDFRLFTFVIGNSANQPLLEALARESGGFAMNVSNSDDIIGRILQAQAKVMHDSIVDTRIEFDGQAVSAVTPESIGNLYIGQQIVLFGRYPSAGGIDIKMTGKINGRERQWICRAVLPETDTDNPELERLWAQSAIAEHMQKIRDTGETRALREQIVALGTRYSLVSDYTSMVVVEDDEMEKESLARSNTQRVARERKAQQARNGQPVKNYRADDPAADGGMFNNHSAPGIGSGPVGPLFLVMACWLRRRSKR